MPQRLFSASIRPTEKAPSSLERTLSCPDLFMEHFKMFLTTELISAEVTAGDALIAAQTGIQVPLNIKDGKGFKKL